MTATGLVLTEAAVKGSGAGMEPGEGAVLVGGWWRWQIVPPRKLPRLVLAASGATGGGWRVCDPVTDTCREIGADADAPIILAPCGA